MVDTNKDKQSKFPLYSGGYRMIFIGFAIVLIGFVLMMGGGNDSMSIFSYDIFSFRRISLAPIIVLLGFGFIFWAIIRKKPSK